MKLGMHVPALILLVNLPFDECHVRRRATGQSTAQARIFEHLNAERVRTKPRSPVKIDGARMIEGAGVHEETLDRLCPGKRDRIIH